MARKLEPHEIKDMKIGVYFKLSGLARNQIDRRIETLGIEKVKDNDPGVGRPGILLKKEDIVRLENYENIEFRGLKTTVEISEMLNVKRSDIRGIAKGHNLKATKIKMVPYYSLDQIEVMINGKSPVIPKIKIKSKKIKHNREIGLYHRLQDDYFYEPEYLRMG